MKFIIILGVILIVIVLLHKVYMSETKWIQSDLDNRWYLIKSNNITDAQYKENANALAEINKRVQILIESETVKNRYPKLKQIYSPEKLSEAAIDNRYTTFTVDKSDIHVCLRTRNDQKELYEINRLMYVIIHELAHMANWDPKTDEPIIGHGPEFMAIFRDLVKQSISLGLYKWVDYTKNPQEYCGIVIYQNVVG